MAGSVPVAKSLEDIYTEDALPTQKKRWQNLLSQFTSTYGHPADFVSRSPGRVNILGEHIDYSLYGVLPMAIAADVLVAVRVVDNSSAPEGSYKINISNVQSQKFPTREFITPYASVEIDATVHEWTNYFKSGLKGVVDSLHKTLGSSFKPQSMEILVDGTVPAGGGLSSSAAFVCASALAVMYANGQHTVDKTSLTELAIVSERAVGVNAGGMDQSASIFSLRGSALFVSFSPSLSARPVNFPSTSPELTFLIAQSFVQSDKHVTAPECYNLRVVECSLAASYLNTVARNPGSSLPIDNAPLGVSLRGFMESYINDNPGSSKLEDQLKLMIDLTKKHLTKEEGYTRQEISETIGISVEKLNQDFCTAFPVRAERFKLQQRALHVFGEALRVLEFLSLLENPSSLSSSSQDTTAFNQKLGDLMNITQDSCRDLYECSCPEIDELCTIARKAGAYGSRLTGAGWGGCTVNLVPADRVEAVKAAWESEYYSKLKGLSEEQRAEAVVVSKPGSGSAVFVVDETKGDLI